MIWLMIFAMAMLVFCSRYVFLEPRLPLRLRGNALHFLSYSAPAALTAILAPIIFVRDDALSLGIDNYYLLCALVAAVLAAVTRNTLITIVVSMGLFFMLH